MSISAKPQSFYRPEIDGLRALAVVAVIINHFNKDILPSGYLGVDIFFVISGYVITSSLINKSPKNLGDFLLEFYSRRIQRIVPALIVCVLITGLLICLFNPNPEFSLKTGITSLFGLSNLYLLKQTTNYFGESAELNAFTQTWSLGVEEQFYFLFPLLIWFTFTRLGYQTTRGIRNLILITLFLTIISLIAYIYVARTNQVVAYFLMPLRFWQLSTGCLVYFCVKSPNKILKRRLNNIPPILLIVLIIASLFIPLDFSVYATIAMVFLTALLIASLRTNTYCYSLLTNSHVRYIGLISYSLYLWHWSILSVGRWTISICWWSVPILILLTFALSILSYHVVEKPLRMTEWSNLRWKKIGYGLSSSVIIAGLMLGMGIHKNSMYLGDKIAQVEYVGYTRTINGQSCVLSPGHGDNMPPCFLDYKDSSHQLDSEQPTIWITGDSHAQQLAGAADDLATINHRNVGIVAVEAAPFPPNPVIRKIDGTSLSKARYSEQIRVKEFIVNYAKRGDVLLISNSGSYVRSKKMVWPDASWRGNNKDDFLQRIFSEVRELAILLEKKGINVVYILPLPMFDEYPYETCLPQWFRVLDKRCVQKVDLANEEKLYQPIKFNINKLANEHQNLHVFDPMKDFCNQKFCKNIVGSKYASYDTSHLTSYGASILGKDLGHYLQRVFSISARKEVVQEVSELVELDKVAKITTVSNLER